MVKVADRPTTEQSRSSSTAQSHSHADLVLDRVENLAKQTEAAYLSRAVDAGLAKGQSILGDSNIGIQLTRRYADASSQMDKVDLSLQTHSRSIGIDINQVPAEIYGKSFAQSVEQIRTIASVQVEQYFLNKESTFNPQKCATVQKQTKEFIDLMVQAQLEGSISLNLSAADAFRLVAHNLSGLSLQDRAASENLLGDHGVRHLVGHNINSCMQLAQGLQNQGVNVSAMDRLIMHQTMLWHDLGYAMPVVRDQINRDGIRGQDFGHNVLAAQFVRQEYTSPDSVWRSVFRPNDFECIHNAILFHDRDVNGNPGVKLTPGNHRDEGVRESNIQAIVRIADNTHAFEDKLPELMYSVPETLKLMRLLVTSAQVAPEKMPVYKQELKDAINASDKFGAEDKKALAMAIDQLNENSHNFTVGRIVGNKPEFSVLKDGNNSLKVSITVHDSAIHREVVSLFNAREYQQLQKFLKDLGCNEDFSAPLSADRGVSLKAGDLTFTLLPYKNETSDGYNYASIPKTDLQAAIEQQISVSGDPNFRTWVAQDNSLARNQSGLATEMKRYVESQRTLDDATKFMDRVGTLLPANLEVRDVTSALFAAEVFIQSIQKERANLLNSYYTT